VLSGTHRSCRTVVAALLACLVSLTAACGSSASDGTSVGSADNGSDLGGEPYVQIDLDITGDVTLKGAGKGGLRTNNGIDYDSCDTYGAGEDDGDGAKEMVYGQDLREPVDGKTILVGLKITNYHGAGTYQRKDLADVAGGAGIDLGDSLYSQEPGSTGTMTADGKGGGKWEFTGLSTTEPDGTTGKHTIAGNVTFTCKNG
jgi:hypothetical protein